MLRMTVDVDDNVYDDDDDDDDEEEEDDDDDDGDGDGDGAGGVHVEMWHLPCEASTSLFTPWPIPIVRYTTSATQSQAVNKAG